ncbi:hypothetical protein EON82_02455 [bacterium]|nr:MAG: hypothetical protein EON82_02455 [bacterium]
MRSLLFASVVFGTVYAAQEPAPQRTVTFPGGSAEARGVCEVRPESIRCWDMAGAKSAELEESMRAVLANGQEVSFRVGKKNRILVIRRPQALSVSYRTNPNNSLYGNWQQQGEPTTEFVRYSAEPSETEVVLTAQTVVQSPNDEEIAFAEGTSGQIDGRRVEIGAVQKIDPAKAPNPRFYGYNRPPSGTAWNVVLGLSGKENDYVNWTFTPLNSSGQPIRYVDASGKPITAIRALALEPNLSPNNYNPYPNDPAAPKPKAAVAYFQGGGSAPAFRATTNVDPKAIAKLRIRASHQESAALGPFPLDPK